MPVQIHDHTQFGVVVDDWNRLRGTPVEQWLKKNFQKVWDLYTSNWSYINSAALETGAFNEPDTSLAVVRTTMGTNSRSGSRYRYQAMGEDVETGTIVPLRTISDDGLTVSSFPLEVLAHLSEDIPTLDLKTKSFTSQRIPLIKARQSDRARIDRYAEWRSQPIYSDVLGAFSFFGEVDGANTAQGSYVPAELTQASIVAQLETQLPVDASGRQKKVPTYRIGSLYRGGGPEPTVEKWQSKLSTVERGSTIFAYKREVEILNQFSLTWETKMMICLGTFEPLHKAIAYKKARAFWPGLLHSFAGGSTDRWFDTQAWRRQRSEHWAAICKFWDAPMETFGDATMDAPPEISMPLAGGPLEDKHFAWIESAEGIKRHPDEIKYRKIEKKVGEIEDKKAVATRNLHTKKRVIEENRYRIEDAQRKIERLQSDIAQREENTARLDAEQETIQQEVDALTPTAASIAEALVAQKLVRDAAIQALTSAPAEGSSGWLTNIERTMGIEIREVYYEEPTGMRTYKLSEYPDAPSKVASERWKMKIVEFTTNKPMIIKVDAHERGENCKKVAGGPWFVRMSTSGRGFRPSLSVRLLSASSIFGKSDNSYKVHPHTNQFTIRARDYEGWARELIANDHNACLGEAEPILYKAFEDSNVKMAIMGAMTWLGNANGSDAWGKHWKWFPKASDVNLDGTNFISEEEIEAAQEVTIDDLITTDEGMDVLAARLLGNIDEYETVADGYEEAQTVPYQAVVSEDLNNRNNLLNAIQALENRTVQRGGYVPYAGR